MADYNNSKKFLEVEFSYTEKHRGQNRDIYITCNPQRTNAYYECKSGESPLDQDVKWYENHISRFYDRLAEAIAEEYLGHERTWPDSVICTINKKEYTYNIVI